MNTTTEDCPVVNYNPAQYIPMNLFKNQWAEAKLRGAERVNDPYGRNPNAGTVSLYFNSSLPFILMISMAVITLSIISVRAIAPNSPLIVYVQSPITVLALVAFICSLVSIYRRNRFSAKLKNAADFAVMESARRYMKLRYGFLPMGWEDRFISYLVGEEVKEDRFSETYQLNVRNYKGNMVLMVSNINGEAPRKS